MIGRLLYDSQGEIACALEVLRSLAADMDGCMKDELADELSTSYLAPRSICPLYYQVMQALSPSRVFGNVCSIIVDIAGAIGSRRLANHGQPWEE